MTPHEKVVEMCGNFDEKSKEDLAIRAERQRARANKWMQRCAQLEQQLADQKEEYDQKMELAVDEFRVCGEKFNEKIESVRDELYSAKEEIGKLRREKIESHTQGYREGAKFERQHWAREIRLGQKELQKQRNERINAKIDKLVDGEWWEDDMEPVVWLRRAIKRHCGVLPHVYIDIVENSSKPPKIEGHSGYWTTPSGKTIITYPNAYNWPKEYHCSTERIVVGRYWINKNIYILALSEAEMKIK